MIGRNGEGMKMGKIIARVRERNNVAQEKRFAAWRLELEMKQLEHQLISNHKAALAHAALLERESDAKREKWRWWCFGG